MWPLGILLKLQPQGPPHAILNLLIVLGPPVAPLLGGIDVGGTLIVGLSQQVHDREQDLLYRLDGGPTLGGMLVVIWIVAGGMEDGDTDEAARIY